MKVDSLLQREGRGPVERTGPIPLPGRRPRHLAGPARRPVHPDAVTEPIRVPRALPVRPIPSATPSPGRPGAGFAVPSGAFPVPVDARGPDVASPPPAVRRERDPRPTPAGGVPVGPALPRTRDARPGPPRRPDDAPPAVRRVPGPPTPAGGRDAVPYAEVPPLPPRRGGWRSGRRRSRTTLVVVLALIAAALGALAVAVAARFATGPDTSAPDGPPDGPAVVVLTGPRPSPV